MQYWFHDVAYKERIIRYVKPPGLNSDGYQIATNFDEMRVLSHYIEYREPSTIVIALLGRGIIACSKEDASRGPILAAFQQEYKRLPDKNYHWKTGELVID